LNLVTVMNYDLSDKNYLVMCCNWIKQVGRNLSKYDSCFIFTKSRPHPVLSSFATRDSRFRFCIREGMKDTKSVYFPMCSTHSEGENLTYKLYIACGLDFPFIFMDADTVMLEPLKELEPLFDEMPAIFIDHEHVKGHTDGFPPFINSGVFMVNDPCKSVFNWSNFLKHAEKCGFNCKFKGSNKHISGTDQSVIKSYFDSIGYAYDHEKFGIEYNTCAEGVVIKKNKTGRWIANNSKGDPVKVVHYWGPFKPWSVGCPIFKELLDDEMFNRDDVLGQTRKFE
jgi:hypothetical protein